MHWCKTSHIAGFVFIDALKRKVVTDFESEKEMKLWKNKGIDLLLSLCPLPNAQVGQIYISMHIALKMSYSDCQWDWNSVAVN